MNLFSSFLPVHQERSVTGMDAPGTPQVSELIYIYIICVYIYIYITDYLVWILIFHHTTILVKSTNTTTTAGVSLLFDACKIRLFSPIILTTIFFALIAITSIKQEASIEEGQK